MQLQQWLQKNPTLKDKALADAVMTQPWDPSVQAMAGLPDVVNRLANDIQWTADLGNAFLALPFYFDLFRRFERASVLGLRAHALDGVHDVALLYRRIWFRRSAGGVRARET